VFGNSDAAVADPDWVGYIEPDAGIVGLDGAEVRENAETLVEQDGGIHGPFFEGRRAVVINVILDPHNRSMAYTNELERRLRRAARALREDAVLSWTPSDLGVELRLLLRRNAKPTFAGRRPKTAQLPMVSADSAIRSSVEQQVTLTPGVGAGVIGYTSPYVSPYGTDVNPLASALIDNSGDLDAIPRFRLVGPITDPQIINDTTGQRIKLALSLAAGEALTIDVGRKQVGIPVPVTFGDVANYVENPRGAIDTARYETATSFGLNSGAVLARFDNGAPFPPAENLTYFLLTMSNAGIGFMGARSSQMVGPFKAGKPYTFSVLLYLQSGDPDVELLLGDDTNLDYASASLNLPATTWARYHAITWTPTADRETARFWIRNSNAVGVASTIAFTEGRLYQGSPGDFDGYVDGDDDGIDWVGVRHASESRNVSEYGLDSRFGSVVYPDTKWWRLRPGANAIRLEADTSGAGAQLTAYWRTAYE
jgi:hypothetical protein